MDALLSQWRAALLWPSLACVKEVVAHSLQSRAEQSPLMEEGMWQGGKSVGLATQVLALPPA